VACLVVLTFQARNIPDELLAASACFDLEVTRKRTRPPRLGDLEAAMGGEHASDVRCGNSNRKASIGFTVEARFDQHCSTTGWSRCCLSAAAPGAALIPA
jgi:hypothetical protein